MNVIYVIYDSGLFENGLYKILSIKKVWCIPKHDSIIE